MTSILDLLKEDEAPDVRYAAAEGVIPVGYVTRLFLERGATGEEPQRQQALHAARNLLGAGVELDEAVERIYEALAEKSVQMRPEQPWTYGDVRKLVVSIATSPAPPLPAFERGDVIVDHLLESRSETEDGTFRFGYEGGVQIEVSRVVATVRGTMAWVRVMRGEAEVAAVECEIRTAQGVTGAWRYFEKFGVSEGMLEQARREVLKARSAGGLPVFIDDVLVPSKPHLRVSPMIVNGHLNVIFATGGSGKSLLMLMLASIIQEGRTHAGLAVERGNVLYLDWEQGGEDARGTLDALRAGMGGTGNFLYMRCTSTLVEMAEDIGRLIVAHDIHVVMIDSLTFALGGDKNDAGTVTGGTNAMRLWREGTTTIALDHVAKEQEGRRKEDPFGSIFVRNAARNMLRIEAWMDVEAHELHQVIYQTKTNKGVLPAYGLRYTFEPESFAPEVIFVQREDPPFDVAAKEQEKRDAQKTQKAPQREKVYSFLKGHGEQLWAAGAVATLTNVPLETVKSALKWLTEQGYAYEVRGSGRQPNTYGTLEKITP